MMQNLRYFSLFLVAYRATNIQISVDFDISGMTMLDQVLGSTADFTDILSHGCWCAKLDPNAENNTPYGLGGPEVLDPVDQICKNWFITRHCNDDLSGGSCKAVAGSENQFYVADKTDPNNIVCPSNGQNACQTDSCVIDVHFASEIKNYLDANGAWSPKTVNDYDTCLLSEFLTPGSTCTGTAPNLKQISAGRRR